MDINKEKYRIMIETSNICNAHCFFCANQSLIRTKMVMEDQIFELIMYRLQKEKLGVEKFILHLNGEPFTDKKLLDRVQRIKSIWPDVPVWFTTNFSLPSHELIDRLLDSGVDCITISLNTTDKEKYKQITGLDFEKTMRNVHYLCNRNTQLGNPINIRLSIVDKGDRGEVDNFIKQYSALAEIRVIKLGRWLGKEYKKVECAKQNIYRYCDDLYHQICILSNGDFALCSFDCEGQVHLNVKDTSILEAFHSVEYENLREEHKKGIIGTICEDCSFSFYD